MFEGIYVTGKVPRPDETKEMMIGTLTHQQVLEPHLDSGITIIPRDALNADGHKKGPNWKAFELANAGKNLLKQDEYDEVLGSVLAVRKKMKGLIDHPRAAREYEIYWTHEATGIKMRAKLDLLVMDQGEWWMPDLKTCNDITRFGREVENRALWLQPAVYRDAVRTQLKRDAKFWFCVVEKKGTNQVWHFELDEDALAEADARYESTMAEIKRRYDENDWSAWQEKGTNGNGTVILSKRDCFGWSAT